MSPDCGRPRPACRPTRFGAASITVAAMALHAAEDKTFRGASVAGFGTPWGDFVNGDEPNDGYHRVWGRDLYQQATGLIAAGDFRPGAAHGGIPVERAVRRHGCARSGTTYAAGSFPRYSPVSGSGAATPADLGCCEQLDEEAFATLLAWMTGLTDNATYQKIKATADHIAATGPATTERWEEQFGRSPSSIAAVIAGLVAAADIARQNGDPASAALWESTADSWCSSLAGWTFTTAGYWGGHDYYERIDPMTDPNGAQTLHFDEGDFYARRRRGLRLPRSRAARSSSRPTTPTWRRRCALRLGVRRQLGGAGHGAQRRRLLPPLQPRQLRRERQRLHRMAGQRTQALRAVLACPFRGARAIRDRQRASGQRLPSGDGRCGQRRLLRAGAGLGPPGHRLLLEGRPTGSAAPLNWAEGQYLRLAQAIDAGSNLDTPSVVKARYRGAGPIRGVSGECVDVRDGSAASAPSRFSPATGRPRKAGPGAAATGRFARSASAWTSPAARRPPGRPCSSGPATGRARRSGAGDGRTVW